VGARYWKTSLMRSRFNGRDSLLSTLSEEVVALAAAVVPATAIVTGQTRDFTESSGSAWLYDSQHLVTNHHVVDGLMKPAWVRFPGSRETEAKVVGTDALTDLALLQVTGQSARPFGIRQSPAQLGELCFALGSPLGQFPESMSFGIVSGLKRSLPTSGTWSIYDVIQTDCAINPGNSGGPLVSIDGQVLGVNTAIAKGAEGIGFAVPADTVADIIPELLTHGSVDRVSLGISVKSRPDREWDNADCLVVTAVNSPGAVAFMKGDVLLTVGPHEVRSSQDLIRILRRDMVNRRVAVSVRRDGRREALECMPSRLT
jgi:serine protease Do